MPDIKGTETDTSRIADIVGSIRRDIDQIVQIRNVLSGQVLSELEPYWQGEAKEAFEKQFSEFLTAFAEFVKGCEALNTELDTSGKTYSKADQSVLQLIANLPR